MNWTEILLVIFLIWIFSPKGRRGERSYCRSYKLTDSPIPMQFRVPVTAEPDYICINCGMMIKTGHGHTIEECKNYNKGRPKQPDHRCTSPFPFKGASRLPQIKKPRYLITGTFKNLEDHR